MENLKNRIEKGLDTVIRQFELMVSFKVYIPKIKELENELFSNDKVKSKNGLKGIESLLSINRAWMEVISVDVLSDKGNTYKDKFVDNFNNWDEWYNFMENIVEDAKKYYAEMFE